MMAAGSPGARRRSTNTKRTTTAMTGKTARMRRTT
jgi:hypothetical protein